MKGDPGEEGGRQEGGPKNPAESGMSEGLDFAAFRASFDGGVHPASTTWACFHAAAFSGIERAAW